MNSIKTIIVFIYYRCKPFTKATLEENQRKRDDANAACELVVIEVDPVGTVGPDCHPDAEEQHQRGKADSAGEQRRRDARCEQKPSRQDE